MKKYDVLVVGAGFSGAVAARELAEAGLSVLVIDKREHIGGNCYDALDEHGVLIHPYGPHIFHTSRGDVVDWIGRFTGWRPYEHRVIGLVENRLVPIPFNLTSLRYCFSTHEACLLEKALVTEYGQGAQIPILTLRESADARLHDLADYIYDRIFAGYTIKQWGLSPADLDPAVTGRVPVRVSHDDRYFTDYFQSMPAEGFTPLFQQMLRHDAIEVRLRTSFAELDGVDWKACVYTGTIDGFFHYTLGALPYRSLKFVFQHGGQARHLPAAVLNYPAADVPFTRISEYKQLTGQTVRGTTLSLEFPMAHEPGKNIPYYPVAAEANATLYHDYQKKSKQECPNIFFAGRLGGYRYFNMDDAVRSSLQIARNVLEFVAN